MKDHDINPSVISDEVALALENHRPVVALESTIITHGMPYPRNLETAKAAEVAVRKAGATPATIAIIDGSVRVGLSERQLHRLADPATQPGKCSTRDIAFQISQGQTSGTTVAATMHIAFGAGIRVFATGGIGGVHRGAQETMDISADLQALESYPMVVVCAGPKSVLDIGLTLEQLETRGVAVVGFGTQTVPAFYTRSSNYPVDYRVENPQEVARAALAQWKLGLKQSLLVVNPVPASDAMEPTLIESMIQTALERANVQGVTGKDVTPFLLEHIKDATGGKSLETNVSLMLNNARLAALIASAC